MLFTPGAPRTRKIFQRDSDGKVTGFLSRREERDVTFKRGLMTGVTVRA